MSPSFEYRGSPIADISHLGQVVCVRWRQHRLRQTFLVSGLLEHRFKLFRPSPPVFPGGSLIRPPPLALRQICPPVPQHFTIRGFDRQSKLRITTSGPRCLSPSEDSCLRGVIFQTCPFLLHLLRRTQRLGSGSGWVPLSVENARQAHLLSDFSFWG